MLTSTRNFLFKSGLTALAVVIYGCHSDSANKFEPPSKKQVEKQYVTKDKEKTVSAKSSETPALPPKIKISKTAAKSRNISKVVMNNANGDAFLANINFVTRWNILGPFPYKAEKQVDNKIKSVLHDKLLIGEKNLPAAKNRQPRQNGNWYVLNHRANQEKLISEVFSKTNATT